MNANDASGEAKQGRAVLNPTSHHKNKTQKCVFLLHSSGPLLTFSRPTVQMDSTKEHLQSCQDYG